MSSPECDENASSINEKTKANLSKELKVVLKNAASEFPLSERLSSEATQTLCNVIEAIFIHGLKDRYFLKGSRHAKYPEPNFWPFVLKYTPRSIRTQIDALKQIHTEIGKARAWIRIVINESGMEHYLRMFCRDANSFSTFYHETAYLRDFEHFSVFTGYMKGIAKLNVCAPVNSTFLNTWTPTPLILAGLVSGKPARLEELRVRRRQGSLSDSADAEEVGESALDLIYGDESAGNQQTLLRPHSSKGYHMNEEDELSSIYSHPSMIDGGILRVPYYPVASTPDRALQRNAVREDSAVFSESYNVVVQRRRHRARNASKSSSEGGGCPSWSDAQGSSRNESPAGPRAPLLRSISPISISKPDAEVFSVKGETKMVDLAVDSDNRESTTSDEASYPSKPTTMNNEEANKEDVAYSDSLADVKIGGEKVAEESVDSGVVDTLGQPQESPHGSVDECTLHKEIEHPCVTSERAPNESNPIDINVNHLNNIASEILSPMVRYDELRGAVGLCAYCV